ncbi:MAG: penicillin acylase family protein [Pseudomonadota bacterium]
MRQVLLLLTVLIPSAAVAEQVSILRDEWGVPHIYSKTDAGAAAGYIYAQAQDNFWQVEDTLIQALGRSAEVYGEASLGADYLNRALDIRGLAQAEYGRLDPQIKAIVDAAAAGLNQYLADSGITPRLINRFEPWHFLAYSRFTTYQLFVFNRARIDNQEIAAWSQGRLTSASFSQGSRATIALNAVADAQSKAGSNAWALAPSKTSSGHATLFINPHQPYFGPGQWYEGHLHSEQGLHFSGAGFFASPTPTIGHNEHLGWTHTVNEPDTIDIYALTVDSLDAPTTYAYAGGERSLTRWEDTLRVKTEAGMASRTFTFYRSHHGPVVARRGEKLLAVRMAMFVEGGQLRQRYDMVRATDLDSFKAALGGLNTPMFNTMYADREGNIFYAYYGAVPRRNADIDWSKPVDGSDPATEWQGYHPLEELPTYTNPSSGYLQNCNATPFLATAAQDNLQHTDFPSYMVAEADNNRSRRSRMLLGGDARLSYRALRDMTWDTYVLEAETTLPVLFQELAARDIRGAEGKDLQRAAKLLARWDRRATKRSTATSLYFFWRFTQRQLGVEEPLAAFRQAVEYMQTTYGSIAVPWGEINRLQRAHSSGRESFDDNAASLAIAGGPGNPFGTIFNFYARPQAGKQRMYGIAGHSYVALVEFGPQTRTDSLLTFGASADPASPHYFDQAQLFARQRYKRAWFSRQEVEAAQRSRVEIELRF